MNKRAWTVKVGGWMVLGGLVFGETAARGGATRTQDELRMSDQRGVLVHTVWTETDAGDKRTTISVTPLGADAKPTGGALEMYKGASVKPATAFGSGGAIAVLVQGGASPLVRVTLAKSDGTAPRTVVAPRQNDGKFTPAKAAVCADPEGFAVMWQEYSNQTGPADVRTYFGRIKPDGSWRKPPAIVAVPWDFGALAWNGHGYHAALYYGTASQTRLCFVTLTADGVPEQHPWWASPAEVVAEVQLLSTSAGMRAIYRSSAAGTELHGVVSAAEGKWGVEPSPARSYGALPLDAPFALRANSDGEATIVKLP